MLRALYDLSLRRNLVEDPLYEKKPVDFLLRLDGQGTLLSLVPMRDDRGRGKQLLVPRVPKRAVNIAPAFLVDNSKYVLGLDDPEKQNDERLSRCMDAFQELVSRCAQDTGDEGARAVLGFLKARKRALDKLLRGHPREEWKGSETLAFSLSGDEHPCVHLRPAVRDWWARENAASSGTDAHRVRCLVTGVLAPTARLHPSIKRVPNAQPVGASIVSFNADAFVSQGLEQGENAPVSNVAAVGYSTALNWLLQGTSTRRFQYGVPVGDDAVTVFWTREESPVMALLASLMEPTPEEAILLAESPWRGLEPSADDAMPFYAATLSGNAARVVVRDWLESTAAAVKANVRRYFDDLRLAPERPAPTPLRELVASVKAPSGRGLSPDLATRLFNAALRGSPFPRELLGASLRRLRLPPEKLGENRALQLRCSLIKATLLRLPRSGTVKNLEIPVSLDANNSQTPYLLGRLFAVLERLQGVALGDINATIRDRYFGAASMTPGLIFPRLLRLSMHHAAKSEAGWLERLKGEIVSALPPDRFPKLLPLEDQGLFAIGYYHQREHFFRKRDAQEPAPDASLPPLTPT